MLNASSMSQCWSTQIIPLACSMTTRLSSASRSCCVVRCDACSSEALATKLAAMSVRIRATRISLSCHCRGSAVDVHRADRLVPHAQREPQDAVDLASHRLRRPLRPAPDLAFDLLHDDDVALTERVDARALLELFLDRLEHQRQLVDAGHRTQLPALVDDAHAGAPHPEDGDHVLGKPVQHLADLVTAGERARELRQDAGEELYVETPTTPWHARTLSEAPCSPASPVTVSLACPARTLPGPLTQPRLGLPAGIDVVVPGG